LMYKVRSLIGPFWKQYSKILRIWPIEKNSGVKGHKT
jgi:hypothetical protein